MKKIIKLTRDNWEPAISDGLTLPCGVCNRVPSFDYHVDDKFWKLIAGDHPHRFGVICLPCFDKLAVGKGQDISTHLEFVQFTGIGKTIELIPSRLFQYEPHFGPQNGGTGTHQDEGGGELGEVRVLGGVWGEKPVAEMHWEYGGGYYHEMDMDFWLKKLKVEYDDMRSTLLSIGLVKNRKFEAVRELTPPDGLPPMSYHEYVNKVREALK